MSSPSATESSNSHPYDPTVQVLHHISSRPRRIRLLRELLRVLRPAGTALVTVWASEQEEPRKVAKWVPIPPPTSRGIAEASLHCLDRQSAVSSSTTAQRKPSIPTPQGPAPEAPLGTQVPGPSGVEPEPCAAADSPTAVPCLCRQPDGAASFGQEDPPLQGNFGNFATGDGVGPVAVENGRGPEGGDFLVPWHVPFHRVEAGGLAAKLLQQHATASRPGDRKRVPEPSGDPAEPHHGSRRPTSLPGDPQEPQAALSQYRGDPASSPEPRRGQEPCSSGLRPADSSSGDPGSVPQSLRGPGSSQPGPAGAPDTSPASAEGGSPPSRTEEPKEVPLGAPRLDAAKQSVVYSRYYHLFNEGELEGLVAEVPGARLVNAYYDKSNWCVIVQRDSSE